MSEPCIPKDLQRIVPLDEVGVDLLYDYGTVIWKDLDVTQRARLDGLGEAMCCALDLDYSEEGDEEKSLGVTNTPKPKTARTRCSGWMGWPEGSGHQALAFERDTHCFYQLQGVLPKDWEQTEKWKRTPVERIKKEC